MKSKGEEPGDWTRWDGMGEGPGEDSVLATDMENKSAE